MRAFNVSVSHDASHGVWFVQTSDIPGLNVESPTFDGLVEVMLDAAPDLVAANVETDATDATEFEIRVHHTAIARRVAA